MEKQVKSIVFRRLTYADFRHINKVGGEETGGGGQSYIDFPTADITLEDWKEFLGNSTGSGKYGRPRWDFIINSLGLMTQKKLRIFQRREASVSISSQKIHSSKSNRVPAWHPDNGFPEDYDPSKDNLVVYIVKTTDGEYWAGWFLQNKVPSGWPINKQLNRLFLEDSAGVISLRSKVYIETAGNAWPFYFYRDSSELNNNIQSHVVDHLNEEDTSVELRQGENLNVKPRVKAKLLKIRERSNQIVKNLKELYKGQCQISGVKFTFRKRDGEFYSEAHHLIPLGKAGSDTYANIIIVSPLIHRMLHYANVGPIDLSKIKNNKLDITINGETFEITWHQSHASVVADSLSD